MHKGEQIPNNCFMPPIPIGGLVPPCSIAEVASPRLKAISTKKVQDKLDLSRATVYGRGKKGHKQYRSDFPKWFKEGGLRRYYEHEVDDYLRRLGANR